MEILNGICSDRVIASNIGSVSTQVLFNDISSISSNSNCREVFSEQEPAQGKFILPSRRCGPALRADRAHHSDVVRIHEQVAKDRVLFWQGDRHEQEIEVIEGVVRAVHLYESGERQVLAFFWPGSILRPSAGQVRSFTAEAVTNGLVRVGRPAPAAEVPGANGQVLGEVLDLLHSISRRSALSRLAWFLLRMRRYLPRVSPGADVYRFMIPRSDIADHLGLSLETVSRGLTTLKTGGAIDLPSRKTIRYRGLAHLARLENG